MRKLVFLFMGCLVMMACEKEVFAIDCSVYYMVIRRFYGKRCGNCSGKRHGYGHSHG